MDFLSIIVLLCLLFGVSQIVSTAVSTTFSQRRSKSLSSSLRTTTNVPSSSTSTLLQRVGILRDVVLVSSKKVVGKSSSSSSSSAQVPTRVGPLQVFIDTIKNGRRHLLAAAIARTASIFIMYPVDAIKTRLQLQQLNPFRLSGLFNGVGGSLLGQVPYGVLAFGSYEMYKQALLDKFPSIEPIWIYAIAAILGDLTGSGWICPSEVVKQQVQAGMYPTTGAAIANIWKQKGLGGFYQGYLGAISRDVPFRVAQLTTFEVTKSIFLRFKRKRHISKVTATTTKSTAKVPLPPSIELTPLEAALCGAVSGSFSAAITSPLDRIKTLLMTNSQAYGGTVLNCAAKIWRDEGIAGITTGMAPRVIYIAPSVVIFFVVYEMSQQKLKKYYGQHQ